MQGLLMHTINVSASFRSLIRRNGLVVERDWRQFLSRKVFRHSIIMINDLYCDKQSTFRSDNYSTALYQVRIMHKPFNINIMVIWQF